VACRTSRDPSPRISTHVERNRYSVPASFANRPVSVRWYAERLVVATEGQVIAEHPRTIHRSHDAGRTIYGHRVGHGVAGDHRCPAEGGEFGGLFSIG
jgi:hypothetical protein